LRAEQLLDLMRSRILDRLGEHVVGMYLFGSLATGDFDAGVSDVDVLVVTGGDLGPSERAALRDMHDRLVADESEWDDRIEVIYLSTGALASFRTGRSQLSVTSPGEPFHTVAAGHEWLVNWYNVRQTGRTLCGPAARVVIPAISINEVRDELRDQVRGWPSRVAASTTHPVDVAYAVLTVARAWDTISNGAVRCKLQSADWMKQQLPQWAELLEHAVAVRASGGRDGAFDPAEAARFVDDIARRVG
jgi:predicted nucleotidyltransferase